MDFLLIQDIRYSQRFPRLLECFTLTFSELNRSYNVSTSDRAITMHHIKLPSLDYGKGSENFTEDEDNSQKRTEVNQKRFV